MPTFQNNHNQLFYNELKPTFRLRLYAIFLGTVKTPDIFTGQQLTHSTHFCFKTLQSLTLLIILGF